jgi:hypothetical protein
VQYSSVHRIVDQLAVALLRCHVEENLSEDSVGQISVRDIVLLHQKNTLPSYPCTYVRICPHPDQLACTAATYRQKVPCPTFLSSIRQGDGNEVEGSARLHDTVLSEG